MRTITVLGPFLLCAFSACGDIAVKSVRVSEAVPVALQGQWTGTWASSSNSASGDVEVNLQSFDGQPVVGLVISNPCLTPGNYQLVVTGSMLELRSDGEPRFLAVLGPDRTLIGTYQCAEDSGTWMAVWQRDLPTIGDLRGVWEGTVTTATVPSSRLQITLDQRVVGGQLAIEGSMTFPDLLPRSLPVAGTVRFREGSFDIVFSTEAGVSPAVQLAGLGDSTALAIQDGLLVAQAGTLLPFAQALWQMSWSRR